MKKDDLESGRTDQPLAYSGRFKTPSLNIETLEDINGQNPPNFKIHMSHKSDMNGDLK
jgi:hypothetical protein